MNTRKYLPVWTDGLNYGDQHLTFWIADNLERVNKNYSLLPIRLEGDYYCERKRFDNYIHLIDNYFENRTCRITSQIVPIAYYVAEKAFDAAANEFFEKYPSAFNVEFHNINNNGVYDTKFKIDYATRLGLFETILDAKVDEFCIVDEVFIYEKKEQERHIPWPEYSITARLDIKEEDLQYNFPKILESYGYPYIPKKNIKVIKEDVYKYYFTVPEKIFCLSNQYIKYNENSKKYFKFFRAAERRDLIAIEKYLQSGIDINTIDSDGRTVFAKYTGSAFDLEKEQCNTEDLKTLLSWGANPAIYGAGFNEEPLENVCLDENIEAIELLLKSGVSPHSFPCIDETYEDMSETLLERTERWAVGDPNIDSIPNETQQIILEMLKEYV